jgi:hypothetical protein
MGHFDGFTYIFVSFGESCFLVSWCACDRCIMAGSDEYHDRSMTPDAKDQGWSCTGQVLDGRMIGRSDDAVCGLHRARGDEEREFLG